jgi:hypothetical protein
VAFREPGQQGAKPVRSKGSIISALPGLVWVRRLERVGGGKAFQAGRGIELFDGDLCLSNQLCSAVVVALPVRARTIRFSRSGSSGSASAVVALVVPLIVPFCFIIASFKCLLASCVKLCGCQMHGSCSRDWFRQPVKLFATADDRPALVVNVRHRLVRTAIEERRAAPVEIRAAGAD